MPGESMETFTARSGLPAFLEGVCSSVMFSRLPHTLQAASSPRASIAANSAWSRAISAWISGDGMPSLGFTLQMFGIKEVYRDSSGRRANDQPALRDRHVGRARATSPRGGRRSSRDPMRRAVLHRRTGSPAPHVE
jgi:hypothetical protein